MRARRWLLGLLVLAVAGNGLVISQVWHFTHFVRGGERTDSPEALGLAGKLRVLLLGVRVPRPTLTASPDSLGLVAREELHDGVSTWTIDGDGRGTVALFHGYGGAKSELLHEAKVLHDAGFTTVLVDFPGSGESVGNRTTLGWEEAEVVQAVARDRQRPLVLYGQSMGSAAILRAAGVLGVEADGLILESPFDRLVTTIGHRFEAMGLPAWPGAPLLVFWGGVLLGYDGFAHNPVDYGRRVEVPTLLLLGEDDPRVRPEEVQAIAAAMAGRAQTVLFPGAGHERLMLADPERWWREIDGFLRRSGMDPESAPEEGGAPPPTPTR